MLIIAQPAFSNKDQNPYNFLLYSNLKSQVDVNIEEDFSIKNLIKLDILHMHWPEYFLSFKSTRKAYIAFIALLIKLLLTKLFNGKIIWTVHNLKSHENHHPFLSKLFYRLYPKLCDGFIFLSKVSLNQAKELHLINNKSKTAIIPHGHYKDIYKTTNKIEARSKLDISNSNTVFGFLGLIRPYKNVPILIEVFSAANIKNKFLLIAGACNFQNLLEIINDKTRNKKDIKFINKFLNKDELEIYISAMDVVVLPFNNITNSGSVLLALSMGKKVIAPNLGSLKEIQEYVGKENLVLYQGSLTKEILENVNNTKEIGEINLSEFDWDKISKQTLSFYKQIQTNKTTSVKGKRND